MIRIQLFIVVASVLFSFQLLSQTSTNVQRLNQLSQEYANDWEQSQIRVKQYAKDNNLPIRQVLDDGTLVEMVDIRDGKPYYYMTDNLGAAKTTRVIDLWEGGGSGLDLTGEGYEQLGEWDGGAVRKSHQEFTDQGASRVTQMDGNSSTHYHATHVAGTMVAAGIDENAKGMAYGGKLKAWEWSNDESEMAAAAAQGLEISNHSYGAGAGWESNGGGWSWYGNDAISATEDYKFGFYDNDSRVMDQIAYNAPNYLIVRSAGNERGEGPSDAGQNGKPEIDGGTDGYDCIQPEKLAKNVMTVGAANEVAEYNGPQSVSISGFSSFGPADDGRVKPDIVGKGVSTFSTMDGSDTDYASLSGTSMSAPNVSGSMALLQSYYQSLKNDVPMRSATLRGLVLHTADEAGDYEGPDYIFGWGLMNTERAASFITTDSIQNVIEELLLVEDDTYIREVVVAEGSDLRITICWTDPPGIPSAPALNPRTPMLVNDLDLTITDAENNTYYPYSLDPDNPSAAATMDGKNEVDNVEMILIQGAEPGNYTISVVHDGVLQNNEQAFSIIVSGIDEYTIVPECTTGMISPENGAEGLLLNEWIEWEAASYATSYDVYFGTDGDGIETPTSVFNGENMTNTGFYYYMTPNTTYYLQLIPRNSLGVALDCDQIFSFTTMEAVYQYPYTESFSETDPPLMAYGWQTKDLSEGIWLSTDLVGRTDKYSMFCSNPAGYVETDFDNWLISPPFSVEEGKEYYISYYYSGLFPQPAENLSLYWSYTPFVEDMTNLLYQDDEILGNGWVEATAVVVPEDGDVLFFGWHMNSIGGKAALLDDIFVSDWGTVGVNPETQSPDALIYSYAGKLIVKADEFWNDADLKITNLMGQIVYQGKYQDQLEIAPAGNGLFIVSLSKANNLITRKVVLN